MEKINITKPILKWVGGKTQIIENIISQFPKNIDNYHEIFLGGGSVLLALLSYIKNGIIVVNGKIYAYDANRPLIYVYKNIQKKHIELYENLQEIISQFNSCGDGDIIRNPKNMTEAKLSRENYYYWIRNEYNNLDINTKITPKGSAMFIFLNKTCFRGLFRIGPKGFNVPYGHYKNPEILNKKHLEEVHDLIKGVLFKVRDFTISLQNPKSGDYVYLDPPYIPETSTSFVKYTENGFSMDHHINLFKLIHNLTENNINLLLSNSDVEFVRENFNSEKYHKLSIVAKRKINSKNPKSKTRELVIKNY